MGTRTLTLEMPEELIALFGSPESAAAMAKTALVLELLRDGRIGQSFAAEILGLMRWDVLDLMMEHRIPSGPVTAAEVREEFEAIRRYPREQALRAGDQQQQPPHLLQPYRRA